MAYFENQRKVKRITLPSDPNLWVDVYSKLTWKEEKAVGEARTKGEVPYDAVLKSMIADWNLEDERGIAPVDEEHIDQLNRDDALVILSAIEGLMVVSTPDKTEKKSSSSKSPQP